MSATADHGSSSLSKKGDGLRIKKYLVQLCTPSGAIVKILFGALSDKDSDGCSDVDSLLSVIRSNVSSEGRFRADPGSCEFSQDRI